jgi:hypothetical protein
MTRRVSRLRQREIIGSGHYRRGLRREPVRVLIVEDVQVMAGSIAPAIETVIGAGYLIRVA